MLFKHFVLTLLAAIQCYNDNLCTSVIGSEKKTVEECCETFENGGLGGVHYSIGDQCLNCLNALGKITYYLLKHLPDV